MTYSRIGLIASEPVTAWGHREVVLESTDESKAWSPGHAEWVCRACGARGNKTDELRAVNCEPSRLASDD